MSDSGNGNGNGNGRRTCQGTTPDGECGSTAVLTSGFCSAHDPDMQARMQTARRLGGHMRSRARDGIDLGALNDPKDARVALSRIVVATASGKVTPEQAKVAQAGISLFLRAWEAEHVDEQIKDLQARAAAQARR